MTARSRRQTRGALARPGSYDPWQHNRDVKTRKQYRRIERQIKASTRVLQRLAVQMGIAADEAAEFAQVARSVVFEGLS